LYYSMKKIKAFLHSQIKQSIPMIAKLSGVNLLDKQATFKKLKDFRVYAQDGEEIEISPAGITGSEIPESFKNSLFVHTSFTGVYHIKKGSQKIKVYPHGGIKIGTDVPDMDFGSALFIKSILKKDTRPVIKTATCIVLWSHYWGNGYFDYMVFIYAKLLRIKSVMSMEEFEQAKIAYPVFGTAFESELLKYAGVTTDQLINVRNYNVDAGNYYLGNNENWYYPNQHDLLLIRNVLLANMAFGDQGNERIYISRKGRRVLSNEEEMIDLLKDFNFTIIDDTPRSVAEQIRIYKDARVIIGPHGASFTTMICCDPGTTLIELFPGNYYPAYFRFLATALHLKYFAIFEDNIQDTHYRNLDADMYIDTLKVKNLLERILI
jgi:hypothetical protein